MKFMQYAVLVMSLQSGIALGADVKEPEFTPEDRAQYASYIKKIVEPYEKKYAYGLQNKQNLYLYEHFTFRSDFQDENGHWGKNLSTVYLTIKDALLFADGSAKPGFEIVIKQGRFERVAPCDTGAPVCPKQTLSFADLDMLALHIRASGKNVIELGDGIECELKDRPKIKGTAWPVYSELIFRYAVQEDRDNLQS